MLRDYMLGAFSMLMLITFVQHNSDESKQRREIKTMIYECEQNLPRTENCVIVVLPKSKD